MDALVLHAAAVLARQIFVRRAVARVVPSDQGLHLVFDHTPQGLRLACGPGRGALYPCASAPPRVKGGRGAWPDLAGAADARLRGDVLEALDVTGRPVVARLRFASGARLDLFLLASGGLLRLTVSGEGAGAAEWTLPRRRGDLPAPGAAVEPAALAARVAEEGAPDLADRLLGLDGPAFVAGPAGWDGAPAAAHAGRLRVALAPPAAAPGEAVRAYEGLGPALEAWHAAEAAAAALLARRDGVVRALRREAERARRAVAAIARDAGRAPDPLELRRRAEALLAAGPALREEGGRLLVPDPLDPGSMFEIPVEPPGARPHEVADRLFARARKERRGSAERARRGADLERRAAELDRLAAGAAAADAGPEIAAAEEGARRLGLAVGLDAPGKAAAPAAGARAPRGEEAGLARVFRSPGGFEVLAGRSAAQNDRLTFDVAGPDDWWFHAHGRAGAHVVLRLAGRRDAPQADLEFAAALAAAFSRAPEGEAVDVVAARRRHVRKPRGAKAGSVTVQKSITLRVVARRPTSS